MMKVSTSMTRQRAATQINARQIEKKLFPRAIKGPENYDFMTSASS